MRNNIKINHDEVLKAWRKPGNIIYSSYWMNYDRVLSHSDDGHKVTVISCDKTGTPLEGAKERTHFTYPSDHDEAFDENGWSLGKFYDFRTKYIEL